VHRDTLAPSLADADEVWLHAPADLGWDVSAVIGTLGAKAHAAPSVDALVQSVVPGLRAGDHVLIMSNGGFGGIHEKLLTSLAQRSAQ